jgi:hypothetical protein
MKSRTKSSKAPAAGAVILIGLVAALIAPRTMAQGGGVQLVLTELSPTGSASADVTVCGDATCTGNKLVICAPLSQTGMGNDSETCASGGGWKAYQYSITLGDGATCGPQIVSMGTAPACGSAELSGNTGNGGNPKKNK